VSGPGTLARLEAIVDASGVAEPIEALLPVGVRPRQLAVRTLLLGILLVLADGRPAHLSRVGDALVGLLPDEQRRLGVVVDWKAGPHLLTYRQIERTFSLVVGALGAGQGDGTAATALQEVTDDLLEASVPAACKDASRSYAVDWTDVESFSSRRRVDGAYNDPDASWGHRKGGGPGEKDERFFGYYLQLATMVADEGGATVAELARRMALTSCLVDPPPALVGVLEAMAASGVAVGDVLCDSGYSHRVAEHWALPIRRLGAELVMDLHPHDRGTQGTFAGAICWNGNLYCPATPKALFCLEPLSRQASTAETEAHDRRAAELARYKLGRASAPDPDGYHRVMCPAAMGKVRCPRREPSLALPFDRPEITAAPDPGPTCCTRQTITVPPEVNAKTTQKHDYPGPTHRRSYARRSAAERSNATIKDPASTDVARGWCRVMGLTPMTVLLVCALVVRNLRVLDAFEKRQADDERRRAAGLEPKTRRRRRRTINDLVGATVTAPP
jgi:hypothetical protein